MTGRRIGIALGGGSARGWAHIGVLEVLEEAGFAPSLVAGTSMGALVGGAWVAGGMDGLKSWALRADRRRIAGMIDVNFRTGGLMDGQRINGFLSGLGLDKDIGELPAAYTAVATDLAEGDEIWLRQGSLVSAIRASIAIPGIISPCRHDGRWLVDGGLANQIPISACRAMGAEVVVAVNVSAGLLAKHAASFRSTEPDTARISEILEQVPAPLYPLADRVLPQLMAGGPQSPGYFEALAASFSIVQDRLAAARLSEAPPDVMIVPQVAAISLMEFDRAAEAIEAGRAAAEAALEKIETLATRDSPV